MTNRIFASIALIALSSNAFSQTPCAELDNLIDASIFEIAMTRTEGDVYDKSAPQQTARYIDINNQLQILNINLAIHTQNKCPARKAGIVPFKYQTQASDCVLAKLKSEGVASKCNFKKWKPE